MKNVQVCYVTYILVCISPIENIASSINMFAGNYQMIVNKNVTKI